MVHFSQGAFNPESRSISGDYSAPSGIERSFLKEMTGGWRGVEGVEETEDDVWREGGGEKEENGKGGKRFEKYCEIAVGNTPSRLFHKSTGHIPLMIPNATTFLPPPLPPPRLSFLFPLFVHLECQRNISRSIAIFAQNPIFAVLSPSIFFNNSQQWLMCFF